MYSFLLIPLGFGLISLFNSISTFVGYFMPNFLVGLFYILNIVYIKYQMFTNEFIVYFLPLCSVLVHHGYTYAHIGP